MNEHAATPEAIRADAERQLAEIGTTPSPDPARPDDATMLVAGRVLRLRKSRGWTLDYAATKTGHLGRAQLSKLERGERGCTVPDLFALAAAYGIPVADLVGPGEICGACGQELPR